MSAAHNGCISDVKKRRQVLASLIERAIDLLDAMDGDLDAEPDDDGEAETDLGAAEDEGMVAIPGYRGSGAGCPVFEGG